MKTFTKILLAATAVITAIIAIQIALTCAFSFHTGELFSKTAVTALYIYCVCRMFRTRRKTAQ